MIRRWWRRAVRAAIVLAALGGAALAIVMYPSTPPALTFPDGKRFAFSIVDDTDQTTVARGRPLYDVLYDAGLRTTKTVWALDKAPDAVPTDAGESLADPDYRAWILELQRKGFEIGLHGVRGGSSERAVTQAGLAYYREVLGTDPRHHVNHALNKENLYWGEHRWYFPPFRWAFGMLSSFGFDGENQASPYFWGDLARERIRYVRRFTYRDINLMTVSPWMPYRVPGMEYVPYWYDGSDGGSIDQFEALLSDENLDRLEREGGVTLVYAHLGAGSFNQGDGADPRFVARVQAVARRNGWFVPASQILDHLATQPGWTPEPSMRQQLQLELRFILEKVF